MADAEEQLRSTRRAVLLTVLNHRGSYVKEQIVQGSAFVTLWVLKWRQWCCAYRRHQLAGLRGRVIVGVGLGLLVSLYLGLKRQREPRSLRKKLQEQLIMQEKQKHLLLLYQSQEEQG